MKLLLEAVGCCVDRAPPSSSSTSMQTLEDECTTPQCSPLQDHACRAWREMSSVRASPRCDLPNLKQLTTSSGSCLTALLLRLSCPLSATVRSRSSMQATNLTIQATETANGRRKPPDPAPESGTGSTHLSFFLVADQRRPMTSGKDDSAEFDAEIHRSIEQVRRA